MARFAERKRVTRGGSAEILQQAVAHPARLGAARIGNRDLLDRKLSGRVDELLLPGRTMNDAEITELCEAGNPYR